MKQCPQEMLNGITTRSPTLRSPACIPTSSTMPIASCPSTSPGVMNAPRTSYRCKSEPQMFVLVTLMIASVGSLMIGSGIVSTVTFRLPCQVTARTKPSSCRSELDVPAEHGEKTCGCVRVYLLLGRLQHLHGQRHDRLRDALSHLEGGIGHLRAGRGAAAEPAVQRATGGFEVDV